MIETERERRVDLNSRRKDFLRKKKGEGKGREGGGNENEVFVGIEQGTCRKMTDRQSTLLYRIKQFIYQGSILACLFVDELALDWIGLDWIIPRPEF